MRSPLAACPTRVLSVCLSLCLSFSLSVAACPTRVQAFTSPPRVLPTMPLTIALAHVLALHHAGRQIEEMDHGINVLQHEAWTFVNRLQELNHKEDIDRKRHESPSLFRGSESSPSTRAGANPSSRLVCASCGVASVLTKDDVRREYEKKHEELKARIQEVSRLRAKLETLQELDKNFVSLPELVRLLTAPDHPCAELLSPCRHADHTYPPHRPMPHSRSFVRATPST